MVAEPCSWSRIISARVKFTQVEARKGWKSSETIIRLLGASELSCWFKTSSALWSCGGQGGVVLERHAQVGLLGKDTQVSHPVGLLCPGNQG